MRGALVVIFIVLNTIAGFCQSVPLLRTTGNEHFENDRYYEAIQYLKKVVAFDKEDTDSRFKLARSYFKTFQFEKAKTELSLLIDQSNREQSAEALLYFGNILKLSQEYADADSVYSHLITTYDVSENILEHARKEREGCIIALKQGQKKRGFSINLFESTNSEYHDFGAAVNKSLQTLVYLTTSKISGQQFQSTQFSGLLPDLIQLQYSNNKWRSASNRNNFDKLNSPWAEGSGSFTQDGKTFYFTSCREEQGSNCQIFYSNLIEDKWTKPIALNEHINAKGYENKHPFITNSGDTIFFVSNRPGGFGGSDIWMSLKGLDENSWTTAINLGEVINTEYDEITPYYSNSYNCLAFSSNGHVGYGGYDIFIAKGQSFFEPNIYNIGSPFNSSLDDTYFYIYDSAGFMSSNRSDRIHLNIYDFNVNDESLFLSLLIAGESLIDQRVVSRYKQIRSVDLTTFRVEDYQGFELFDPVKRKKPKPEILKSSPFESKEELIVDNSNIEEKAAPRKSDSSEEQQVETNYSAPFISGNKSNRGNLKVYGYERIYFSFGKDELNDDAKITIDNLAEQLRTKNNYDHVEIRVYSDPVGPADYNLKLSQKRGEKVSELLQSKGIPRVQIKVIPKGESSLLSSGTEWYDNFFNRRAEIDILSEEEISISKARKLVVRQSISVQEAGKKLNIATDDLMKWNQLSGNTLQKGDIIRIESQLRAAPDIHYFIDHIDIKNKVFKYRIKEGETLESLARKFNTPEELILEINNLNSTPQTGDLLYLYRGL